jgi:hypothetical protein
MLLYIMKDEQGHMDVMPTMTEVKKAVKGVMWERKSTWITEVNVPQDKANVLALVRASKGLPAEIAEKATGRTWWVTERGGVKEEDKDE